MNHQNFEDQFSDELSQAIRSTASVEVPTEAVQRVISQSIDLAHSRQANASPKKNGKFYLERYLIPLCVAVAFLVPVTVRMFRHHLGFIPGWEHAGVQGAFTGFAAISLAFLTWSFGQQLIGATPKPKRTTTTIGWLSQVATLILAGWAISGLFMTPGNLYAQMHQTLSKIKTIQYVMTMSDSETGEVNSKIKNYIVEPNLTRVDSVHDVFSSTLIMDLNQQKCLTLDNQAKTAELLPLYQAEKMLQDSREANDFLRKVSPDAKSIGESIVDGHRCEDFEFEENGCTTVISISKQTSLPVQMKTTLDEFPQFATVANEFVFDEPLDPELFSFEAPEGYEIIEVEHRDPVDDSKLDLIPGESLGSATFGMTVEQVIEALGQPDQTSEFTDTVLMNFDLSDDMDPADALKVFKACTLNYASRGFELSIGKEQGLIAVHCFGMASGGRMFQGQISDGIAMGDSPADVRRVMGKPSREPKFELGETADNLLYKLPNGSTLRFAFEEDKLVLVINRKRD